MEFNPYQVLGVPREATEAQIKEARNFLAAGLHPDRFEPGSKHWHLANEKLKEINAAYEILSKPEARQEYDERTAAAAPEPAAPAAPDVPADEEPAPPEPPSPGRRSVTLVLIGAALLATVVAVGVRHWLATPAEPQASVSASPAPSPATNAGRLAGATPESETKTAPPAPAEFMAREFRGHTAEVTSLATDGVRLISGGTDHTVRVWAIDSAATIDLANFGGSPEDTVWGVAVSPDGKRVAAGFQRPQVQTFETAGLRPERKLEGAKSAVYNLAFSPDGSELAGASFDHSLQIWSLADGSALRTLTLPDQAKAVRFSPDGRLLAAAGTDRMVRVFDTASWAPLVVFKGHTHYAWWVSFSPDGKSLASAGWDGTVRLWDLVGKMAMGTMSVAGVHLHCVEFSPDGTTLAVGASDGHVSLWDVNTRALRSLWEAHTKPVNAVVFSPDGKRLFTAGDSVIKAWNLALAPK